MASCGIGDGRPARLQGRSRAGSCRFRRLGPAARTAASIGLLGWLFAVPGYAGTLTLKLTPGNITFPDASPDLVPVIGPASVSVTVKATGRPGYPWTLTVLANSDLMSGPDVIPISVISWTVSPNPPFADGTLSAITPQLIGMGIAHINTNAQFDFSMQNSWDYNAGNYTATATFTLAAP